MKRLFRGALMALAFAATPVLLLAHDATRPDTTLAAPVNDNFADAISLDYAISATYPMIAQANTAGATLEAAEQQPCGNIGATVWYKWVSPSGGGTAVFETYGSNFDTALAIYAGGTLPTLLAQACNDDHPASSGGSLSTRSTIAYTFPALSATYYIQAGGYSGATGDLVLNYVRAGAMMVGSAADNDVRDSTLTLREAILVGNGTYDKCASLTAAEKAHILDCPHAGISSAQDLIHFNPVTFPIGAPTQIFLGASLPAMSEGDRIDGFGSGVVLDGWTQSFDCLIINGDSNQVGGLQIRRCVNGVVIAGSNNTLGGGGPATRNIITENINGVLVGGTSTSIIADNYIGLTADGSTTAPNTNGIVVNGGAYKYIQRNVVSGNTQAGVAISGASIGAQVTGNYIGTDATGMLDRGNGTYGVLIADASENNIGAPNVQDLNVISGNGLDGIRVYPTVPGIGNATRNNIINNYIGTNAAGSAAIPNGGSGVTLSDAPGNVVGGANWASWHYDNLISGNDAGITITGAYAGGNYIQNNRIGTNAAGTAAIPNVQYGIRVTNDATGNLIGGDEATEQNLISGNGGDGLRIDSAGSGTAKYLTVQAPPLPLPSLATTEDTMLVPATRILDVNVTLDITHTYDADLDISLRSPSGTTVNLSDDNGGDGNDYTNTTFDDESGFPITSGSPPFTGSYSPEQSLSAFDGESAGGSWTLIISDDNTGDSGTLKSWSLTLTAEGNQVSANYIGTDDSGTGPLANGGNGVTLFWSPSNSIGGAAAGEANTIAYNAGDGVRVDGLAAISNTIRTNSIHSNTGAGIENVNAGNQEPGFAPPLITAAGSASGTSCPFCVVDVFSDSATEGRAYHGSAAANGTGNWSYAGAVSGPNITATATNGTGSTSEFSLPFACGDADGDAVNTCADNCPAWPNPSQVLPNWPVPAGDSDCDGFSDAAEGTLGTVATQQCPVAGNPDAWPPDFNKSGSVSVTDVLAMKPHFGLAVPPAPVRFDLVPSGSVSVSDVLELKPYFNKGCS